jgi:hypothetical protein
MSIFPHGLSVFRALVLGCLLTGAATSSRATVVLDWDSVGWTSGSLSNSYDVTGDGVTDVTVSVSSQPSNIWTNDPTTGMLTPTINQTLTGGLSPAQNSLMLAANLKTHSDVTVQLSFTGGNQLGKDVSFTIFDIDVTTNSDIISGIYGVALDGSQVAATITNVGSAVTQTGSGLGSVFTGNAAAANNSSNGNVTISFGSAVITDVFFLWSNGSGAPRYQDIAIGDITFTPVPEVNPVVTAVASCFLAIGLTIFARRRAKVRASLRSV